MKAASAWGNRGRQMSARGGVFAQTRTLKWVWPGWAQARQNVLNSAQIELRGTLGSPKLHLAREGSVAAVKAEADRHAANVLPIIKGRKEQARTHCAQ